MPSPPVDANANGRLKPVVWTRRIVPISLVILVALFSWQLIAQKFGSIRGAMLSLTGHSFAINHRHVSSAANGIATFVVEVRSLSSHPLRVTGIRGDCDCVKFSQVPVSIRPYEVEEIRVELTGANLPRRETLHLWVDDESRRYSIDVELEIAATADRRSQELTLNFVAAPR